MLRLRAIKELSQYRPTVHAWAPPGPGMDSAQREQGQPCWAEEHNVGQILLDKVNII